MIDPAALVAILLGGPDAGRFVEAIAGARARLTSGADLPAAAIVVDDQMDPAAGREER